MITPAYAPTATERVLPRMALDFTTGSLDARVTVTRALNTATRVNSSGLIETINANLPRFDYVPATLACKGLLIEEARTNLALYSTQFDDVSWTKVESTVSANASNGPDGTLSADKFIPSTNNVSNHLIRTNLVAPVGNNAWSVFVAPAGYSWVRLLGVKGDGTQYSAYFNVTTGVVGTVGASTTATIEGPFANGFYRCTIASTVSSASAAAQNQFIYAASADNTATFAGNGTSGYHLWGAQLEAGAFATSYIPTTTLAVLRNADAVSMTGTNFSSWFNANQGTFVATTSVLNLALNRPIMQTTTAGLSNGSQYVYYNPASSRFGYRVYDAAGTAVGAVNYTNAGTPVINTPYCAAIGYKTDSFAISVNGAAVGLDTLGTVSGTADTLLIGSDTSITYLNGHAKSLRFYPLRLTNAETQAFSKG